MIWISVEEKLPERTGSLCIITDGKIIIPAKYSHHHRHWRQDKAKDQIPESQDVTHWFLLTSVPLPEKPVHDPFVYDSTHFDTLMDKPCSDLIRYETTEKILKEYKPLLKKLAKI